MSCSLPIQTERLELIPATLEILKSDLHHNHEELGRLLNAIIPTAWPPPLLDQDALNLFVSMFSDGSDPHFCTWYWIRTGPTGTDRTLIGSGGTLSYPTSPDAVMIGYSVLDAFQNFGYATEALWRIIPVIFARPGIRRIIATTYPELKASIRVLEK
ncbi:MAG: GNAT family N-acetyltransferase, partial [Methanoregula sp.]|nr:GNAT family N-acetyltransferase [Methanoregula sp.]